MKHSASSAPDRDPASRRADRRTPLARRLDDVALFGVGATMAIGAAVFAYAMLTQTDGKPHINGMEYLAIFSQPRHAPRVAAPPTPAEVAANALDRTPTGAIARPADNPSGGAAVDQSPTGAISPRAGDAPAAPTYRIIAAEPGMAWLNDGAQIRALKPGDVAPGLPRIGAITRRDGRWALLDESGVVLLMSDQSEERGPGSRSDPFARRMIFSSGD